MLLKVNAGNKLTLICHSFPIYRLYDEKKYCLCLDCRIYKIIHKPFLIKNSNLFKNFHLTRSYFLCIINGRSNKHAVQHTNNLKKTSYLFQTQSLLNISHLIKELQEHRRGELKEKIRLLRVTTYNQSEKKKKICRNILL